MFSLIMDAIKRYNIRDAVLWCIVFAGNAVLVREITEEFNERLKYYRTVLKWRELRITRSNTEKITYDFEENN